MNTDPVPQDASAAVQLRKMGWRDWRPLALLFRQLFPELSSRQIASLILQSEDTIVVATLKEEIVGLYHCIYKTDQGTAWLNYFGVEPTHTRQGIASQLLQDYETRAVQMGFKQAELDVLQHNQTAILFYERHGYRHQHALPGKLRYRKSLGTAAGSSPQAVRPQPRLARIGRQLLYRVLVSLKLED